MEANPKKIFTTAQNFRLLEEKLGENKKLPTKKQMREFLDYWQDVYDIWKINNPSDDLSNIDKKIKVRKELIKRFGIRT